MTLSCRKENQDTREDFHHFNHTLVFDSKTESGQLVIVKANPSGLIEKQEEVSYGVYFNACDPTDL